MQGIGAGGWGRTAGVGVQSLVEGRSGRRGGGQESVTLSPVEGPGRLLGFRPQNRSQGAEQAGQIGVGAQDVPGRCGRGPREPRGSVRIFSHEVRVGTSPAATRPAGETVCVAGAGLQGDFTTRCCSQ